MSSAREAVRGALLGSRTLFAGSPLQWNGRRHNRKELLNANHPAVRRMNVDSLRYWVKEMHVDGFRFDLASILARDSSGAVMLNPPVLWDIESDPALAGTKMIAELIAGEGVNGCMA